MSIALAFRRLEDFFQDEETYQEYRVITYLLCEYDGEYDEYDNPIDSGDVVDRLFEFVADSNDELVESTDKLSLEFLDPDDDSLYHIQKLDEIFAKDVERFSDKLALLIKMEEVKLRIKNRLP